MDLKEIGINTRNWVHLAQERDYWRALVNAALNLQVPQAKGLVIIYVLSVEKNSTIVINTVVFYYPFLCSSKSK